LARGIRSVAADASIELFPIADGGEGTVEILLTRGFSPRTVSVSGPLGTPVDATFAMNGTLAVIEMSSAAGLSLLPVDGPNIETALASSTYGVGELIRYAIDSGATRIVVGLGGSASTDGGAGALEALGARIVNANGRPVDRGGKGLAQATHLDLEHLDDRLGRVDFVLACDVDNPLYGPHGSAHVYAPQKGADSSTIDLLDGALQRWSRIVSTACGADHSHAAGAGAAGGLAMGLAAILNTTMNSGIEVLLDATGFREALTGADLVIVGEGSLDQQSLRGKGPIGVARLAASLGLRVVAVAGRSLITSGEATNEGISTIYTLSQFESDESRSMADAAQLLEQTGRQIARDTLIDAGQGHSAGLDKVVSSAREAVRDIPNGASLAVGGFGLCGIPSVLIDALLETGTTDLEVFSNNCGVDDWGLGILLGARQIRRMVSSYVGENKEFARQYLQGELEVELTPQGTLAERMRAGGCGIPAFYTPAGVGTQIADGGLPWKYTSSGEVSLSSPAKETRTFNGRDYVMEEALVADFALVRAWKGDRHGNLVFRQSSRNFNPLAAMCGAITIAEVEHLVEPGELDPDMIHTPGVFVQRVVALDQTQANSKRIERRTVQPRDADTDKERG
jgi:3-oxoacid CoA-transferase subunit A